MASTMPVENWGQLKFVEVDADKAAGNNENDSTASDACMHIQLQSLPKGDERDRATYVPRPLLSIPITAIASASGTTRNDVSLVLRPHSSVSRDESSSSGGGSSNAQQMTAVELTGVRFAVPNICVGYEQTEEAGKVVLQEVQQQMQVAQRRLLQSHARQRGDGGATGSSAGSAADGHSDDASLLLLATLGGGGGGARADERAIAVFDDATLSYPAGKYKMLVSNYHVVLEDKKRGATSGLTTLPLSNIQQIYLCDVPTHFAKASSSSSAAADDDDAAEQQTLGQYVVLILKAPLKIRSTSYAHLVISCPANMVLDEEHAWQCELQTQEEINRVLGGGGGGAENSVDVGLTPRMSGKVSEILVRVFKAVARVPAYGGSNKEYRSVLTQRRHCCMRCLFHGTEGLLYIVNGGFLFLHRPATLLRFDEVDRVEMDEAESGKATFQLNVYSKAARSSSSATSGGGGGSERYTFSAIDKEEKEGLLSYLNKKGKLVRRGITVDDDDEDSDDDEDEDDDSDESDSSDDGDSDDDEDSDDEDSDDEDEAGGGGKHAKKRRHKHTKSKTTEDKTADDGNDDDDKHGDDTASRTKEKKKKKHSKEEGHKHKHRHHKHKHRHHRDRKRDRDDADKDGDGDGDGDDAKRRRHHRHHHDKKSKKSTHEADDA